MLGEIFTFEMYERIYLVLYYVKFENKSFVCILIYKSLFPLIF